ncbi:hypothetical protein BDP27DRAFT_1314215 [Rhodocollybia butyracea]|uniref:Uncharacterized protein n=1 Tax=Rhodocollybia butyracea TaxID=206335 RepID=A0A9P5Q8P7_9AGAR|nr:hypothetical protein BDP27DRAFT_1314215 [Rhodocollybia butyracea]
MDHACKLLQVYPQVFNGAGRAYDTYSVTMLNRSRYSTGILSLSSMASFGSGDVNRADMIHTYGISIAG